MSFKSTVTGLVVALCVVSCAARTEAATTKCQLTFTDFPGRGTLTNFTLVTHVDVAAGNGGNPVTRTLGGLVVHDPSYNTAEFPFALSLWLGNLNGLTLGLQKPGTDLTPQLPVAASRMNLKLYRDADNGTWVASYKVSAGDSWTEWHTVADADLPNENVSDDDIYVGITAKDWGATPANIDFDYFDIPEVPTPGGTLFIVL